MEGCLGIACTLSCVCYTHAQPAPVLSADPTVLLCARGRAEVHPLGYWQTLGLTDNCVGVGFIRKVGKEMTLQAILVRYVRQ